LSSEIFTILNAVFALRAFGFRNTLERYTYSYSKKFPKQKTFIIPNFLTFHSSSISLSSILPSSSFSISPRSFLPLSLISLHPLHHVLYCFSFLIAHSEPSFLSYFLLYLDSLILYLLACLSVSLSLSLSSPFIHPPFALNLSTSLLAYPFLAFLLLLVFFFFSLQHSVIRLLPPALWSGRTVESIFGAGVDLWSGASSTQK
jgi:hypothetical protein